MDFKKENKLTIKKDGILYEISTDSKISELLEILLPNQDTYNNLQNTNSSFIPNSQDNVNLKNTKQNFIFQLNQNNGLKIKKVCKDDYINGQSDLEELKHPFFSNSSKRVSSSNLNFSNEKKILNFSKEDKIIVFSPHPDDEILGACGLLYKCFTDKHNVKVVYMTSGKGAGNVDTRKDEAINGIKKLGGSEKDLIFTDMPFYERKDKKVTELDQKYAESIILQINPTNIFICSDIFDPHGTHKKCYDILLDIFYSGKFSDVKFYFYYSVWYWPKINEYSHILPYDYEAYKIKIYAMLEHKSQLANKVMGEDPRPFYQRATARDGHYGNIHNSDFCEIYYLINNL